MQLGWVKERSLQLQRSIGCLKMELGISVRLCYPNTGAISMFIPKDGDSLLIFLKTLPLVWRCLHRSSLTSLSWLVLPPVLAALLLHWSRFSCIYFTYSSFGWCLYYFTLSFPFLQAATKSCFNAGFASQRNFAEVYYCLFFLYIYGFFLVLCASSTASSVGNCQRWSSRNGEQVNGYPAWNCCCQ